MARATPVEPAAAAVQIPGVGAGRSRLMTQSNRALAQDFLDLSFQLETGRTLPVLTRFDGPISIGFDGPAPKSAKADLSALILRLNRQAGLDVRPATAGIPPKIAISFLPREAMSDSVPNAACFVVPSAETFEQYLNHSNTWAFDWRKLGRRQYARVFIPADSAPQEVRDCLHEEIAQALGPLNDLYRLSDSVFNDDNFHAVLTDFDILMLRIYYAPELANGMSRSEVALRLPAILARLNPAGASSAPGESSAPGATRLTREPRLHAWRTAAERAFDPDLQPRRRLASAGQLISIAAEQGWNDNRLAFAHFARGRVQMLTDPTAALADFAAADRIYRSLPGTTIHIAHIDMQLAAVALATGQNDQAIRICTQAIPVAEHYENQALRAVLMLIRAEALANAGRSAQARRQRLDSLPWARYGFGSEAEIRVRMSEIALLAARGQTQAPPAPRVTAPAK
jgi:tetratricopeptide (TPR) repeat protein